MTNPRPNPYVGPRSFDLNERLYGRDREIHLLSAQLISERIVLLHSPSGAGKTSLIRAGLVPLLEEEKFNILPVARVNLEPGAAVTLTPSFNRYAYSVIASLEEGLPTEERRPLSVLANLTLDAYLTARPRPDQAPRSDMLFFDQFEEFLTIAPTDREGKQAFFAQLAEALRNANRWALFAIREDYLGALAPYVRPLPNRFEATFRLDLLGVEAALQAIQSPARDADVDFRDEAARKLVDDLRRVQVQQPDGAMESTLGQSVEPVQLQVVCYRLWQELAEDASCIDLGDLARVVDVDQSLAEYYAVNVSGAAAQTGLGERSLREWFETKLITREGFREQVLMGKDASEGLDNRAVRLLENAHVIRGEKRAGATWFELSHDRLIQPIRKNNAAWFEKNLSLFQRRAALWNQQESRRDEGLLLRGEELEVAEREAGESQLLVYEQEFMQACRQLHKREQRDIRQRQIIAGALVVSLILLVLAIFFAGKSQKQASTIQNQNVTLQAGYTQGAKGTADAISTSQAASTQAAFAAFTQSAATQVALSANQTATGVALKLEQTANAQDKANAETLLRQVQIAASYRAQALVANSRQLRDAGSDKLSTLLAIEAFKIVDNYETRGNLLRIVGDPSRLRGQSTPPASDKELRALTFSRDGKTLASGSLDGIISLWDVAGRQPIGQPCSGSTEIESVAFSPDGKTLAFGGWDNPVFLCDVASGELVGQLSGHTDWVFSVAFSPDGKTLASGSRDGTVILWDVANGQQIGQSLSGHGSPVHSVVFSPDGKTLASGSEDGTIILWDVGSGKQIGQSLSGHDNIVYSVAFSPDGKSLASGGYDRKVILWDMEQQAIIGGEPLGRDLGIVKSVAFSPDGRLLVSGDNEGNLTLWDMDNQKLIGQISTNPSDQVINVINVVAFQPDSNILAFGSQNGSIGFRTLDGQAWIEAACGKAGHNNLTLKQWKDYFPRDDYRGTCEQLPTPTPSPTP